MRSAFEDLRAFLLSNAAQYAETLAFCVKLLEVGKPMKHFLLGFVADGACVVKHKGGILDAFDLPIALPEECSDDFFGIVDVHLAAERLQVKRLVRRAVHKARFRPNILRFTHADRSISRLCAPRIKPGSGP